MPQLKALTKQDADKLLENAKHLKAHANAIWSMPIGEQFMGGRDTALHSALLQIAECLEIIAK